MRIFLAALVFTIYTATLKAQPPAPGYEIKATTDYKNVQIYLGNYYGKSKLVVDSAMADSKGVAVFKGEKKFKHIYSKYSSIKKIFIPEEYKDVDQYLKENKHDSNIFKTLN